MASTASQLVYDGLQAHEIEAALALEQQGFPPDEAATLDKLQYRFQHAPELFLGAYTWRPPSQRRLVAFVCSTATRAASLTHDSMSEHQPDGTHVAIHSIVVHPSLQRQGVALALLKAYLERLRANPKYHSAVLISHDNLIPLYQKAGFQLRGKSDVVHGSEPWYELAADVSSPASSSVAPAAAQVASPGKSLQQVGKDQLLCNEHGKNQFALYCPRGACKCLLLRANSAVQVERTKQPFLDPIAKPTPCPPDFPPPDDPSTSDIPYWSVQPPSAMTFENIGFSKSLGSIKFLTCADCDCGPLGWHDTQGADLARDVESSINAVNRGQEGGGQAVTTKEFLLDLRRVRYQV